MLPAHTHADSPQTPGGTGLRVRLSHAVAAGVRACYIIRARSTAGAAAIGTMPVVARFMGSMGATDLAPWVLGGESMGVAPVSARAAHASLCYGSRISADFPVEALRVVEASGVVERKPICA